MIHIKTDTADYYIDDQSRRQGEFKSYHDNGQLRSHCFYLDNECQGEFKTYYDNGSLFRHCFYMHGVHHGEYKLYYYSGQLYEHCFYVDGNVITDEVKQLVSDISNITSEEKLVLKLKLGIGV